MVQYLPHHEPFSKCTGTQRFSFYNCEFTQYCYEGTTYLLHTYSAFNLLLSNVLTGFHIFGILPVQSSTIT